MMLAHLIGWIDRKLALAYLRWVAERRAYIYRLKLEWGDDFDHHAMLDYYDLVRCAWPEER